MRSWQVLEPRQLSGHRGLPQCQNRSVLLSPAAGGLKDPKVFLLSMFELGKYDFHLLEEVMAKDLESHKRHVLLLAMPAISEPVLERKAASLWQLIWLVAAVACGVNPSPMPGVQDVACDLHILIDSLEGYRRSFSLDKDSLVTLAGQTGQPLHKILEAARGPKTVTEALVVELLGQACRDASAFTQELLNVPVLGTLATCGLSFATIYQMLRTSLDKAVKDAESAASGLPRQLRPRAPGEIRSMIPALSLDQLEVAAKDWEDTGSICPQAGWCRGMERNSSSNSPGLSPCAVFVLLSPGSYALSGHCPHLPCSEPPQQPVVPPGMEREGAGHGTREGGTPSSS